MLMLAIIFAAGALYGLGPDHLKAFETSMEQLFEHLAALSLTAKLVYCILGVFLIRSAFRLLERKLPMRFAYGDQRYRVRKMATATAYIVIFIFITILFEDRLKQVGFAV